MNRLKFTLLEILIAMVLLSMLTVGMLSTYSNLNKNWLMATASNQVFYDLLHVEQVLDNSLPNAIPFVWKDSEDDKKPRSTFAGSPQHLTFCYLHPLNNIEEGAIRFMHILVEDNELVAYYKNRPWVDIEDLNDPTLSRVVISSEVKEISIKYAQYDADDEEIIWEDHWENELDSSDEHYDIPLAIQITIDWEDDRSETFLYRTAGNSKYQRWGDWQPGKKQITGGSGNKSGNETPPGGGGDAPPKFYCFPAITLIHTPNGYRQISHLKAGEKVYAYQQKSRSKYIDEIQSVDIHDISHYPIYKLKTSKGSISVTPSHSLRPHGGDFLLSN
jgi:hypothetical protein